MTAFYLEQKLIVQLPITEETPEGGIVAMEPGWYDAANLDPRVVNNPIVHRLIPEDGAAAARMQARADLNRKINAAQATPAEMQALLVEQTTAENEARAAATEAWTAKAQEAADKGAPFTDLHPDPAVNHARAMTATSPQYIAAGAMQSKIMELAPTPATPRPALQPSAQHPAQHQRAAPKE